MKILIYSMDAQGHINACLGIAQSLRSRKHDVFFAINKNLAGDCLRFGFREIQLHKQIRDENNNEVEKNPEEEKEMKKNMMKLFGKQLLDSGLLSGRSSLEKLACLSPERTDQNTNYVKTFYDLLIDFTPQIEEIIENEKPDCIILDHFLLPTVFARGKIPWIFLFSGNPLPIFHDKNLPPPNSGYALPKKDNENWEEFNQELARHYYRSIYDYQMKLNEYFDYKPDTKQSPDQFGILSPYLNIYQYPEELDYYSEEQMPVNFCRVDAFVRKELEEFKIPEKLLKNRLPESKLIYLSLGSMGAYDIELVQRITNILSKTCHKIIVSKGQRGEEYELPDNCWGMNFLPQPNILPLVDLVMTHGGNNTVTESFALGKPMIILPLFADQYDNAQRVHELGYGVRLNTYSFTEQELLSTIDRLLNDKNLNEKFSKISNKIKTANRKEEACKRIEKLVEKK